MKRPARISLAQFVSRNVAILAVGVSLMLMALAGRTAPFTRSQLAYVSDYLGYGIYADGDRPYAKVIEGPDGALYGTTRYGGVNPGLGTLFKIGKDGRGFRILHWFEGRPHDGAGPDYGALTVGTNGLIYGTTGTGGLINFGTVFSIAPDGTNYRTVFDFGNGPETTNAVGNPRCRLVIGSDGRLYGSTQGGTIFRLDHDGSNFQVVHRRRSNAPQAGYSHQAGVIVAADGWIYGTTEAGGRTNSIPDRPVIWDTMGTVYRVRQDGTDYQVLHLFEGSATLDGYGPRCALLEASDGRIYGTTVSGGNFLQDPIWGQFSFGTVFRLNRDGTGYEVIHRFTEENGSNPYGDLIEGPDGVLYGQTGSDVFKLNKDGSEYSVVVGSVGGYPGVTLASDGRLYSTSYGSVFGVNPDGTGFESLYRWTGVFQEAERIPRAPLLRTAGGLIVGTTEAGGISNNGAIFVFGDGPIAQLELNDRAELTNTPGRLYNGLAEGVNGHLYGTTQFGGSNNLGVIFRTDIEGRSITNLHHFGGSGDGRAPRAALVAGADGYLYGSGYQGGSFGRGTIFRIREDGSSYTTLRHLGATTPDGQAIQAALVIGPDGALYGVANSGGASNRGTVFRLARDGSGYVNLRHFAGGTDGANPQTPLLLGSDGYFYGTTTTGGDGFGTIYRLRPDGSDYRLVYRLGGGTNGNQPRGPLIEKPRGILWGCTVSGGTNAGGVLFRARMDGTDYRAVWSFGIENDGKTPFGGLTLDASGHALGTTSAGGDLGYGAVFRFDPEVFFLEVAVVGSDAVVTWDRGTAPDEVQTAVTWADGQPVWESHGAEVETIGNRNRSVVPLGAVQQFLLRVKRGP